MWKASTTSPILAVIIASLARSCRGVNYDTPDLRMLPHDARHLMFPEDIIFSRESVVAIKIMLTICGIIIAVFLYPLYKEDFIAVVQWLRSMTSWNDVAHRFSSVSVLTS